MGIATANLLPDNSTDTNFRAWGKFISDAFTSFGITKTADTGQIDWTTVLKPAQGAVAGYEIRQFTDSLQSTAPLFFKIEYGADSSTSIRPQIYLTFGRGSNGAGALTGVTTIRQGITTNFISTTTTYSCILSGSSNRFTIAMWFNIASGIIFSTCERTKDSNGNDTGEGATIAYLSAAINRINQYYPFSGFVPATQDLGVFIPLGMTSGNDGADVNYYPNFFFRNGTPLNPGITHFAYFSNDVTAYSQAIVPIYGNNKNYYFLGSNAPINTFTRGGTTGVSLAILYE